MFGFGAEVLQDSGDQWHDTGSTFTLGAPVTINYSAFYNLGPRLNFPANSYVAGEAFIGPNFLAAVPEPTSVRLLGFGGLIVWMRVKRVAI